MTGHRHRAFFIGLAALVASTAASAQTLTITATTPIKTPARYNNADCTTGESTFNLDITREGTTNADLVFAIERVQTTCIAVGQPKASIVSPGFIADVSNNDFGANGKPLGGAVVTRTVANKVVVGDLCTTAARKVIMFCAYLIDRSSQNIVASTQVDANFTVDTQVPAAPASLALEGGDGVVTATAAAVTATGAGETISYQFEHRVCGSAADPAADNADDTPESACDAEGPLTVVASTTPSKQLTGLENGVKIEVLARAVDDSGNVSAPTAFQTAVAEQVLGPLDLYDGEPNPLAFTPSCDTGTASTGLLALLAGVLGSTSRRRRARGLALLARLPRPTKRNVMGPLAVLVLGLFGTEARAYDPSIPKEARASVGFFVAPYRPALDDEVLRDDKGDPQTVETTTGTTPKTVFPFYSCVFGDTIIPEIGVDLDAHILDAFGSLQVGLGISGGVAGGKARTVASDGASGGCNAASTTSVELTLLKFRPTITYRLDPLLDHYGFPFVPYGRVGLIALGYAFTTEGRFQKAGTHNAVGARFGYEYALGLMLALDFLDAIDPFTPNTTKRARANGTINHTFLFAEGVVQDISTFGSPGFNFTPDKGVLGTSLLPLMIRAGVSIELL